MATVTDINIHAVPVYDGQNPAGLDPARTGVSRAEGFGKALSESTAAHANNDQKQRVDANQAHDVSTAPGPVAGPETRAGDGSKPGQSRREAVNPSPEAASTSPESVDARHGAQRQELPIEGKDLPGAKAAMAQIRPDANRDQELLILTALKAQGHGVLSKTPQAPPSLSLVGQASVGSPTITGGPEAGLIDLLSPTAAVKDLLGNASGSNLLRSSAAGLTSAVASPAEPNSLGAGLQDRAGQGLVKGLEGVSLRADSSALNAATTLPALADQLGKAPLSGGVTTAAAVITQDRLADLDRRVRAQAGVLGEGRASNALAADGLGDRADLGWRRQDGFADLLAKSATTLSALVQNPTPSVPTQGQPTGQGALSAVQPSFIDSAAMGGAFKLPSGFGASGSSAQGQMVTPFSQPAWAQELAQQAKFMVRDQLQFVELKLKPANLGSVEIVLKQDDAQTTLMFFAKNPAVREALEASLQKLQKGFDDDGLQLEQTFVSDQSLSEHRQQAASEAEQDQGNGLNRPSVGGDQAGITDQQAKLLVPANDQLLDLWA